VQPGVSDEVSAEGRLTISSKLDFNVALRPHFALGAAFMDFLLHRAVKRGADVPSPSEDVVVNKVTCSHVQLKRWRSHQVPPNEGKDPDGGKTTYFDFFISYSPGNTSVFLHG